MTKTIRKLLSVLLLFAVLASVTACGIIIPPRTEEDTDLTEDTTKTTDGPDDTSLETEAPAPDEKTAQDYLDACADSAVPQDKRIIIAAATDSFLLPAADGANDAELLRLERNAAVEKRLGVEIIVVEYDMDTLYEELRASRFSADDNYIADIIALPRSEIGRFAMQGLLTDLRQIPFWHLDMPYYDTQFTEKTAVGNAIYGLYGSFTEAPDKTYTVFYNEALLSGGSATLLESVRNETWTTERLAAVASESADANGLPAGIGTVRDDLGFRVDLSLAAEKAHAAECGFYQTPVFLDAIDAITAACEDTKQWGDVAGADLSATDAREAFLAGKLPFLLDTVGFAEQLTNSGLDWGVLPVPTRSGKVGGSYVDDSVPVIAVPYSVRDNAWSGQVIEALFSASYGLADTYLEDLLSYTVPDYTVYQTIRTVHQNRYTDFGLGFASGCEPLQSILYDSIVADILYRRPISETTVPMMERYHTLFDEAFAAEFRPTGMDEYD